MNNKLDVLIQMAQQAETRNNQRDAEMASFRQQLEAVTGQLWQAPAPTPVAAPTQAPTPVAAPQPQHVPAALRVTPPLAASARTLTSEDFVGKIRPPTTADGPQYFSALGDYVSQFQALEAAEKANLLAESQGWETWHTVAAVVGGVVVAALVGGAVYYFFIAD